MTVPSWSRRRVVRRTNDARHVRQPSPDDPDLCRHIQPSDPPSSIESAFRWEYRVLGLGPYRLPLNGTFRAVPDGVAGPSARSGRRGAGPDRPGSGGGDRPAKGDSHLMYGWASTTPWRFTHDHTCEPGVLRARFLCTDLPDHAVWPRMNTAGIDTAMNDAVASGALVGAAAAVWSCTGTYEG